MSSEHPGQFQPTPPSISAPSQTHAHAGDPGGPNNPGARVRAMQPQVVHVAARPGTLWQTLGIMLGLFMFAGLFIVGVVFGIVIMAAGASMNDMVVRSTYRDGGSDTVAVIPITGVIDEKQAEFMRAAVDHVLNDSSIDAVVLRVDSPGGGVSASDQIWYEVDRLKNSGRPVVASYGGVAASGGYYISCGANHIVAEETCITGSIGVIAQVLTMEQLMDKVGIEPVTLVATGSPEKDVANDMFRTWNDHDKQKIRTILDAAYATFNRRVRDGRGHVITDPKRVDELANGSIYTAQQALEHGLIDSIGYLDQAIAQAETLAGIGTGASKVIIVRKPPSLFDNGLFGLAQSGQAKAALDADAIRRLVNDLSSPRVMYLMR